MIYRRTRPSFAKVARAIKIGAAIHAGAGLALIAYGYYQNHAIRVTHYHVSLNELHPSLEGFTIAQISDLHNTRAFLSGDDEAPKHDALMHVLNSLQPNIIAITGDLLDSRDPHPTRIYAQVKRFAELCPTYYVTGNHERRPIDDPNAREATLAVDVRDTYTAGIDVIREGVEHAGAHYLDNRACLIGSISHPLILMGLSDPLGLSDQSYQQMVDAVLNQASQLELQHDTACPRILMSHRPERAQTYASMNLDLVLAGHAHGGQWRIPGVGGVFSPNQGLFPALTSGMHRLDDGNGGATMMVVSRGLANSSFPLRLNNRVELVMVHLHTGSM